jgi:roadblock/LC7 domain-containing protein
VTWYDQGVNFIKSCQKADGSLVYEQGNKQESALRGTALGVLFLVRSSEILTLPSSDSELIGGEGFPDEALNMKDGQLVGSGAEKDLSEMLKMLDEDASPEQLEAISSAMKKAVQEFKSKDNKSRAEIKVFLRTMVAANNYFRRKIAIRFLASEQDMDNVPALIYALGDTDFRVCIEAQDGLRLISRRIDSLTVTDATRKNAVRDPGVLTDAEKNAMRLDFNDLKMKWTQWFLGIRPDAKLLD